MHLFLKNSYSLALFMAILGALFMPMDVLAQSVYTGTGVEGGLGLLSGISGISDATTVSQIVLAIIAFILDIALLLAILAIIIAGVYLIVSNGDEGNKDKAKKIITYVIIGIVVILFARLIVELVVSVFSNEA
jgi:Mn2+/Fe2+ NRAMP family transporter